MNEVKKQRLQKKEEKQKTLQQLSSELLRVQNETDYNELMKKLVETYPDEIWECVDRAKKAFSSNPNRDFYVMSVLTAQPYNRNLWNQKFLYTLECPRPYLNFTVFKYHRKTDELELLWNLPDRDTLNFYYNNRHKASVQDWPLLKYCIEYKDGTLIKKMKALNGESDEKPSLIVHDQTIFHSA